MFLLSFYFLEFKNHIVALGADGAIVNSGKISGVWAIMKEEMSWIVFVWCMTHRLELAIQSALRDTFFDEVAGMNLRIFYLYQKSPKKPRKFKVNKQIFLIT